MVKHKSADRYVGRPYKYAYFVLLGKYGDVFKNGIIFRFVLTAFNIIAA